MKYKALSFRQPWATLIVQGRKTLDLRTWSTRYRGPLAVYASQEVEKEACQQHGLDAAHLPTGTLIGIVDLVDILPLDEAEYAARQPEHLGGRRFRPGLFGWVLRNPRPLNPPQPARGRLNLFEVEVPANQQQESVLAGATAEMRTDETRQTVTARPVPPAAVNSEFALRVVPEAGGRYRLAFTQTLAESQRQHALYSPPASPLRVRVELGGETLRALAEVILEALRRNGYRPTDLHAACREPFRLDEPTGVRLGLIFLAVKPLSRVARIESIVQGVRAMAAEELYYWYSKCTGGPAAERAQKALRILLADE